MRSNLKHLNLKHLNLKHSIFIFVTLLVVIFVNANDKIYSDDIFDYNTNDYSYKYSGSTSGESGSCTCMVYNQGNPNTNYCGLSPNGDHCTGNFEPQCSTIYSTIYPLLIESCGCSCIGPDPECVNGQTQLCPNQNGVCAGSHQTCINGQWPGCNTNTYINWANSHGWIYQENTETTCDDNLNNDCDADTDCLDTDCQNNPYCLGDDTCLNINHYYNDECDDAEERNSWGKICKVEDCSGSTEYWYDHRGNIIKQNVTIDAYSFIVEYEYDSYNNLIKETLPNNKIIEYDYNNLNQIQGVEYDNKNVDFFYTTGGLIDGSDYENNVETNYDYDDMNRIEDIGISLESENIFNKEYDYDNAGNLRHLYENGNLLAEYLYDNLYRLITVDDNNYYDFNLLNFEYDKSGNRLNKDEDSNFVTYNYEPLSNRLLSVNSGSLLNMEYDANGNLIKVNGVKKYNYNIDNMLVSVDNDGNGFIDEEYVYNYKNQRVKKVEGIVQSSPVIYEDAEITYYVYDLNGNMIYSLIKDLNNKPVVKVPIGGAVITPNNGG